jgi:hypothetical protein
MRARLLALVLMALTAPSAIGAPVWAGTGGTWTIETVTPNGGWPDAAYGPNGPAIAYTQISENSLRYAFRDTSWHTELVATGIFYGSALPQLTFDSNGDAWVMYDRLFPSGIRLGHRTAPNTWSFPLTISDTDPIDLQLAPDGKLALLYEDTTSGLLVYATYDGTTLQTFPIAEGYDGSLTFQGSTPMVVFDDSTDGLSFAERPQSTWDITQVAPSASDRPAICLWPTGAPLIAYAVGYPRDLWLARRRSNVWQSRLVTSLGDTGSQPSVKIVGGAEILIGYKRFSPHGTSAWIQASSFVGGVWSHLVVSQDASVMGNPSLVVGPDDVPHIAFEGNTDLLWATRT